MVGSYKTGLTRQVYNLSKRPVEQNLVFFQEFKKVSKKVISPLKLKFGNWKRKGVLVHMSLKTCD